MIIWHNDKPYTVVWSLRLWQENGSGVPDETKPLREHPVKYSKKIHGNWCPPRKKKTA